MRIPALLLFIVTFPCSAQITSSVEIDKKDLKNWITILTSDSLAGRGTGTIGQQKAEKFIANRFQQLGLTPVNGSYFEKIELTQTYWGDVYLKTSHTKLNNYDQVVFVGKHSVQEEIEREVVFGGNGTEAELNELDVKEKYVLIFSKNLRSDYTLRTSLARKHAAGIILANPNNEKQFESIKLSSREHALQKVLGFARPFQQTNPGKDSVSSLFMQWDTVRTVNCFLIPNNQVRDIMGASISKLQEVIKNNAVNSISATKIKIKSERVVNEIKTANVAGMIKGRTNKTIVVSAHYDHLGKSEHGYFPGADDNASGTSALLELAEAFAGVKDLEYNLMFLATTGEEAGLMGSFYHVNHPTFRAADILCNLNLDMIARTDNKHNNGQYLYCIGSSQWKALDKVIRKADEGYELCSFDHTMNSVREGLYARSDQYSFYKKNIPAIFFFSGLHVDYHAMTDTADKINFKNLAERVGLINAVITLLQEEGIK
jgi:hypothetical protein